MPAAKKSSKRSKRQLSVAEFRAASAELFREDEKRKAKIARVVPPARGLDSDDEIDSPTPRYDLCVAAEGPEGVLKHTNFSQAEFDRIWERIEDFVAANWGVGRGKKPEEAPKDVFFRSVCAMKHCGKWDTVAHMFDKGSSTFQKMVRGFLEVVTPRLYELFVTSQEKMSVEKLTLSGRTFDNFKCARYATDVTFQQSNRPRGNHRESIGYYSGKHHLYGYKVEVSVLPTGLALNCTPHARGSVADITLFRENAEFHVNALKKQSSEVNLPDNDPLHDTHPDEWAVLTDKGYQGLEVDFRAIHPKKRRGRQPLTIAEVNQNDRISHDRVIVENYFGRMKTLWALMADKYRWDEQ
ncbi:hypothetical protein AM587_10011470 [Phytophthora nicotianae]|uniref:DDE Tnp4 domain-containing protein n=2 Tax=Phytophthora nicotianae TaxID=4792 RepID=A0A0W8BWP6_PHYNI|nr:hypothetical protein AM587_10011470 [Phytophthora nicotianae]